jgi:hypothetical protein
MRMVKSQSRAAAVSSDVLMRQVVFVRVEVSSLQADPKTLTNVHIYTYYKYSEKNEGGAWRNIFLRDRSVRAISPGRWIEVDLEMMMLSRR